MSSRRDLLIIVGAAAVSPRAVFAQQKQPVLIGWLGVSSREVSENRLVAFKKELTALGWKAGPQLVIEERWADGSHARLPSLAEDLVARKPALIVVQTIPAAVVMAKAAPKIPIVVLGGDPVAAGLVASFARPGGMITGVYSLSADVSEKYLELLLAAAPKLRQVGFLFDTNNANIAVHKENVRRAVAQHSVEARFAEASRLDEIEPVLAQMAKENVQALVVMSAAMFGARRRIVKFALAQRWPAIGPNSEWAEDGTLLSYGWDPSLGSRRAAYYVDRILKGTKPGDLPIERVSTVELVINMKTARTLKLEIPRDLAVRADRVIE